MVEDIPIEEFEKFKSFLKVYFKNDLIIQENEEDDLGLCLLRKGKVTVYRTGEDHREKIGEISAINFFGEMSLVTGDPRSATVIAESSEVIIYSFKKPDLKALLSNPTWGNMLITRLCGDLQKSNNESLMLRNLNRILEENNKELSEKTRIMEMEKESITRRAGIIFSLVSNIQQAIAEDAVVTAREWKYIKALTTLMKKMITRNTPEILEYFGTVDFAEWEELLSNEMMPGFLGSYLSDYLNRK
ncbi:MAG: cyclic nucleotide-binding domain-containing protein [Anaerolineaceae bacterium]|nr:cyclic nucleotide-binding domain-containing protein [Anaerolineaceae bacterium]